MSYVEKSQAGLDQQMPRIDVIPNRFGSRYEIEIIIPEWTSICPLTGMPDFGEIRIKFTPKDFYVELKSLKYYIHAFRGVGIFYENLANKILQDIVDAIHPHQAVVEIETTPRGGIRSKIRASVGIWI